jgi:putative CocE/NonD family hydrolase
METQMKLFVLLITGIIASACLSFANGDTSKAEPKHGKMEVNIPMRDGTPLSTDIYLPHGKGKHPTVLVRTPYDKNAEAWMGKAFGLYGIVAVVQDVRGKFKSGGEYYPFLNERSDGLQTLKWIREQPWSDGTVAGWGGSYVGYTQWAISDSLNFLTPLLTGANLYDFAYPDSLFSLHTAFVWGFQNAAQTTNKIAPEKLAAGIRMLPLSAADDSTVKDIPFIDDWLMHEKYDSYWHKMDFRGMTTAPILSIAGWYDIFLKTQIDDFQALTDNGSPDSRLIIGPWCHGNQAEKNEYGGLKKTGKPSLIFKYLKNYLKGKDTKLSSPLKDQKYNLFIMERNEYVGSDIWPPKDTRITPYYLGSSGYLSQMKSVSNGVLQYDYSPSDPYPSIGGTILGEGVGPARQNPSAERRDQLVFEMSVSEKPLILLGPVTATLWISSDVQCTDFIVGIQDVFPDGKIINIQEGGAKVRFTGPQPQKNEISVWATGYQVNTGHKLRVIIASSWFPRFNRNLNSGDPIYSSSVIVNAHQKVWFGADTPSSVNLPVYETDHKIKN